MFQKREEKKELSSLLLVDEWTSTARVSLHKKRGERETGHFGENNNKIYGTVVNARLERSSVHRGWLHLSGEVSRAIYYIDYNRVCSNRIRTIVVPYRT